MNEVFLGMVAISLLGVLLYHKYTARNDFTVILRNSKPAVTDTGKITMANKKIILVSAEEMHQVNQKKDELCRFLHTLASCHSKNLTKVSRNA